MKAVFLDRDGVINELVYYAELGIVDSPFTAEQFRLLPGVSSAIKNLRAAGYKAVLVSNQPGVAKGNFSEKTFDEIRGKLKEEMAKDGALLDGEYYCFHHPEAKVKELRVRCRCRKPEPGLLIQAAQDMNLDLAQSWMIGDGLTDVQAGRRAGTKTILLARMKCELCRLMDEMDARPDVVAVSLVAAANYILNGRVSDENLYRLSQH